MKQYYLFNSPARLFILLLTLAFIPDISLAQATYQPYSYHFYQKLNRVQYSPQTRQHTSIKPYMLDSVLRLPYDSLMNIGVREQNTWLGRKLFNEHLIEVQKDDYTFYADFIPDFQIGRDFANNGRTTWLNTRGYQVSGTIQNKFFFYSSGYENQGVFPNYINDFITENKVVPGQMFGKLGSKEQDWTYVTAIASYSPNKNLNLSLAYDKNFIGDGYRSMLLSDVSSNSTSFKLNGSLGDINILSIWSYMIDPQATERDQNRSSSLRKYGAFQYIDWNVDNRFSIGLFHSLLWGKKLESTHSQSSTMQLGLNTKYKVFENTTLYGQFIVNEEWAAQIGFRGFDAFGIRNLNFLGEYNFAKPYSYSSANPLTNYSNYSQPLAHPFGANFKEAVSLINYSFQKFDFSFQANYGFYGLDQNSTDNYGKNIFKPLDENLKNDSKIGQGLKTNLVFLDAKVAYVINPKYNLRIESGVAFRSENNSMKDTKGSLITFGIRSSFRNLYYDF